MITDVVKQLSHLDNQLVSSGFIPPEEALLLPVCRSISDWLKSRSTYASKSDLQNLLDYTFKVDKLDPDDLHGFWEGSVFHCYKTNKLFYPHINDDVIAGNYGFYSFITPKADVTNNQLFTKTKCEYLLEEHKQVTRIDAIGNSIQFYIGEKMVRSEHGNLGRAANESYETESVIRQSFISDVWGHIYGAKNWTSISYPLCVYSGSLIKHLKDNLPESKRKKGAQFVFVDKFTLGGVVEELKSLMSMDHLINALNDFQIRVAIPKLCEHCKEPSSIKSMKNLDLSFSLAEGKYFDRGPGCEYCFEGYSGASILSEGHLSDRNDFVKVITDYLAERECNPESNILSIYTSATKHEYPTLFNDILKKINTGDISPVDVKELML